MFLDSRLRGNDGLQIMRQFYVYILASQRNGTLYIGMTNDLQRRTSQHKDDVMDGFTKQYGVHQLVPRDGHRTAAR